MFNESTNMYLAIEIGGTKLQFAVGDGRGGPLTHLERVEIDRMRGAAGIREKITEVGIRLVRRHQLTRVGIGFGGPVNSSRGMVLRSFQIDGWDGYPIVSWARETLGLPVKLGNDSDLAGLGEARFGAGQGNKVVFYSNVGSGIGGALIIDQQLYCGGSGVACDIGHFRPGLQAVSSYQTVESVSSGWGMSNVAQQRLQNPTPELQDATRELLKKCDGNTAKLDGKILAESLAEGNHLAQEIFEQGIRNFGWALAQMITLLGPNVVVIGGGVPLIGEQLFLEPLRREICRYVFPPMLNTYTVQPAALGEEVVLYGALALADSDT